MKLLYRLTGFILVAFLLNVAVLITVYRLLIVPYGGSFFFDVMCILATECAMLVMIAVMFTAVIKRTVSSPLKNLKRELEEYSPEKPPKMVKETDEISALKNSFVSLTSQLEEEKTKQNRIIASISHDIKTPLTSVMGYSELLMNPDLSPERRTKYLTVIREKAKRIETIVSEFDDYLSADINASLELGVRPVREMCEKFAKDLRDEFNASAEINLICTTDGGIYADEKKLYRVFTNAVSNSIRHSGRKEGLKIDIVITSDKDEFVFSVTDNGSGVKKAELDKIFEPMYTTDKSRSVAGLGLAICREIITVHEGKIYAESEYGKYFSVVFKLPAAKIRRGK